MNGNCHLMVGTATGIAVSLATGLSPETTTLLLSTTMIGSVFPDIDNPKSHVGKLSVPVSTIIGKISAVFGATKEHHRGIFHDMGLYIIGFVLCFLYFKPLIGFFIGALSHCFLDAFNASGVPVLLGVKRFHLAKVDGNSKSAKVLCLILTFVILGIGVYFYISGTTFDFFETTTKTLSNFKK